MRFNVKLRTVPVEIRASRGKAQWSAMFVPRLYGQGLESQWQTVEHTYVVITRSALPLVADKNTNHVENENDPHLQSLNVRSHGRVI